jgi:hypothetical protein
MIAITGEIHFGGREPVVAEWDNVLKFWSARFKDGRPAPVFRDAIAGVFETTLEDLGPDTPEPFLYAATLALASVGGEVTGYVDESTAEPADTKY